jgi:prophage regulatory protein
MRRDLAETAVPAPLARFLSKAEVLKITGWSDTTLWREERAGRFPASVQTSRNRVGYPENEVRTWHEARIAARDARAA